MSFTMKGGWYSYIPVLPESVEDKHIMASYAVCTCGAAKACAPYPPTGHSDYCDINNPPPDTEELPF